MIPIITALISMDAPQGLGCADRKSSERPGGTSRPSDYPHYPDNHQLNPGDDHFGDHYYHQQHNNDLGAQITCVRLFGPLLATGARGAERAVRIWNVQVALFDMPNFNRFDILSILIFFQISSLISISIFSKSPYKY